MPRIEYYQFHMMQILSEIYSLAEYTNFSYSHWQNIPIALKTVFPFDPRELSMDSNLFSGREFNIHKSRDPSHTAYLHPPFVRRAMLHPIINLIFHYLVSSSLK